jgi:hypothetical protein
MTLMLGHFDVGDFDTWKREIFDADPAVRQQAAKGHMLSRSVDNPAKSSCESNSTRWRTRGPSGSAFLLPEAWTKSP